MNRSLTTITLSSTVLLLSWTQLFARKAAGYVPPPLADRLLISFSVIGPSLLIAAALFYLLLRLIDKERAGKRLPLYATLTCLLAVAGTVLAAMDARNDERWNPVLGGILSGSLLFPLGILFLNKRIHGFFRFLLAVLLLVPGALLLLFIIDRWQALLGFLHIASSW